MSKPKHIRPQRGFTMIEVLVALVVTAVGLLGLLKIQALAISSTKEAGSRGLIAAQVESLTASMHANPFYWASATAPDGAALLQPPTTLTVSGPATISDATLGATVAGGCKLLTSKCTPSQVAAVDVQSWAQSMNAQFPTYQARIQCIQAIPVNCAIYITWTENQAAINSTAKSSVPVPTLSFSVYVQP